MTKAVWLVGLLCVACSATSPEPLGAGSGNSNPSADSLSAESFASGPLRVTLSASSLTRPGLVKLSAAVPRGAARVVFLRDGVQFAEDSSAPFEASVAFTKTGQARHQFTVRAISARGSSRTSAAAPLTVNITGRVLYVSPTGQDSNDGLSETAPLPTIQDAVARVRPGDTVLVMNGTYSRLDEPGDDIVNIRTSGTADAWIALMNYPGHAPVMRLRNWNAVRVDGAAYWLIQGLTIMGNRDEITLAQALADEGADPVTNGSGISVTSRYLEPDVHSHHIVIRGNTVYKCPGSGIGTGQADYVTIEDNRVWGNAWYSGYDTSNVSLYQNWNSDASTAVKMIVRRNVIYDGRNLVPFVLGDPDPARRSISDGNGIIIDDSRNTQTFDDPPPSVPKVPYTGRTLIENNLVYKNGGRGIHVYSSDHVDIFNNTAYHNSFQDATPDGEFTVFESGDVRIVDNIAVALDNRRVYIRSFKDEAEKASQVFRNNVVFGGLGADVDASVNLVGVDPGLVGPDRNDFRTGPGSPGINQGDLSLNVQTDLDGRPRPQGGDPDIGAYEVR